MRRLLIGLFRFYQTYISPMKPPSCRFHPTCSSYAIEAVHTHGAGRGVLLAAWRILRCGPWHPGGYDPVPKRFPYKDLDRTKEGNTTCED